LYLYRSFERTQKHQRSATTRRDEADYRRKVARAMSYTRLKARSFAYAQHRVVKAIVST
jgi:hypothetical protein